MTTAPFTCTFCWQPCRDGGPRVLGRSARLACRACHAAILRLAVCWACGEVVCRGDDCVSLGWCFWHRACYGCLLCRSRRVARGSTVAELFGGRGVAGGAAEVAEVPLCAGCAAECGAEGAGGEEEALVGRCLRLANSADGGLARQRWEARVGAAQGQKGAGSAGRDRPPRPGSGSPDGMGGGAECGGLVPQPEAPPAREQSPGHEASRGSTFHVSISDPFGGPAFRPSPTKPLPEWMRLLPGRVALAVGDAPVPPSVLDAHFPRAPRSPGGRGPPETQHGRTPRQAPSVSSKPPAHPWPGLAGEGGCAERPASAEPIHAGQPPCERRSREADQTRTDTSRHASRQRQRDGHSSRGHSSRGADEGVPGRRAARHPRPEESRTAPAAGTQCRMLGRPAPDEAVRDANAATTHTPDPKARESRAQGSAAAARTAVYRGGYAEDRAGSGGEAAGAAPATATGRWRRAE